MFSICCTDVTMLIWAVWALLVYGVSAFIPNAFTPYITSKDYTHQDLTEQGILLAVAEYFESKPAPGKSTSPQAGSLTGIASITARKLFDAYYGSYVPETKLQSAIDDIVNHNTRVEHEHAAEAAWHFNGEQISQGNDILLRLRSEAFDALNVSQPNYATARNMIGQYLHVLQDFYSNTNWNDVNSSTYYSDLGIPGKTLLPVAGSSEDTCKNCGQILPCLFDPPVLVKTKLTSGYRSGQDIVKPSKPTNVTQGKCSHGGKFDTSATSVAVGGINKETNNAAYSPLIQLHAAVSDMAIKHTKYFFAGQTYGLRAVFGNSKFEGLLQLHAGISLCFVIDTSVSSERDAIKQEIQKLISSGSSPYNYILVYTNDGQTSPTVVTKTNGNDILTAFGSINIGSNHLCTYSVLGTEAAATVAEYGSKIYVISDAVPRDDVTIRYIQAMQSQKDLTISFLLTGQCKHKRSVENTYDSIRLLEGNWNLADSLNGKWSLTPLIARNEPVAFDVPHNLDISLQFLVQSGNNWIPTTHPPTGEKIILSVRIHDPKAVLSLNVIEIGDIKKSLNELKRSRIPGIYLIFISNFPKVEHPTVFVEGLDKDQRHFRKRIA